jgi:hypothetical protein
MVVFSMELPAIPLVEAVIVQDAGRILDIGSGDEARCEPDRLNVLSWYSR